MPPPQLIRVDGTLGPNSTGRNKTPKTKRDEYITKPKNQIDELNGHNDDMEAKVKKTKGDAYDPDRTLVAGGLRKRIKAG